MKYNNNKYKIQINKQKKNDSKQNTKYNNIYIHKIVHERQRHTHTHKVDNEKIILKGERVGLLA